MSIGNDIVDLTLPGTAGRYADKRFVDRIITSFEKKYLRTSSRPNRCLWALWAAKESAYKAVARLHPCISSAPRRYQVSLSDRSRGTLWTGRVSTPANTITVRLQYYQQYIHCLGWDPDRVDPLQILTGVGRICRAQQRTVSDPIQASQYARGLARSGIAAFLPAAGTAVTIPSDRRRAGNRPPLVYINGQPTRHLVSLSHDGCWAAFAFASFPDAFRETESDAEPCPADHRGPR